MSILTLQEEVASEAPISQAHVSPGLSAAMVRVDFASPGSGVIEIGTGSFARPVAGSQPFEQLPIRWQAIPIEGIPSAQATFMQWSLRAGKEQPWEVVRSEVSDATSRRIEPLEIMGIFNFV